MGTKCNCLMFKYVFSGQRATHIWRSSGIGWVDLGVGTPQPGGSDTLKLSSHDMVYMRLDRRLLWLFGFPSVRRSFNLPSRRGNSREEDTVAFSSPVHGVGVRGSWRAWLCAHPTTAPVGTGPQRGQSPGGSVSCAGVRPTWICIPALPCDLGRLHGRLL